MPAGKDLSPPNEELLVQQGGTLAFDGTDIIFRHDDSGILKYTVRCERRCEAGVGGTCDLHRGV